MCTHLCPRVTPAAGRVSQGQFNRPPSIVQAPRGPISRGPILFSRRPSLSQQPAGSQVVNGAVRGMSTGGGGGAIAGGGVCTGRAGVNEGGAACAGCGAPERWRPWLSAPRQSRASCRRARASRSGCTGPTADWLSACSSSARAAAHALELSGSGGGACADAAVAAAASSRAAMDRSMETLEPFQRDRFSPPALSAPLKLNASAFQQTAMSRRDPPCAMMHA